MHDRTAGVADGRARTSGIRAAAVLLGCVAALVCSRPSELQGQRLQLRPQAGLYLPTKISLQDGVLHVRQKIGLTVGGALTLTFDERFDVVTALTYIPGYAILRGAGKRIDFGASSHLLSIATRARYWLLSPARKLSWDVHTGLGVVFGGKPAYEDLFQSSTLSGILGTTLSYQIGRIVSLQVQVQERLWRVRFGGPDSGRPKPPLRIAFGFSLPFLEPGH
jgi:hypothetical protein